MLASLSAAGISRGSPAASRKTAETVDPAPPFRVAPRLCHHIGQGRGWAPSVGIWRRSCSSWKSKTRHCCGRFPASVLRHAATVEGLNLNRSRLRVSSAAWKIAGAGFCCIMLSIILLQFSIRFISAAISPPRVAWMIFSRFLHVVFSGLTHNPHEIA